VRAGELELTIEPLFDDQEHDARATTGAIYWEGAALASIDGKPAGRGYLELTGYGKRLNL
jgi:predicted secreted hydrolase